MILKDYANITNLPTTNISYKIENSYLMKWLRAWQRTKVKFNKHEKNFSFTFDDGQNGKGTLAQRLINAK